MLSDKLVIGVALDGPVAVVGDIHGRVDLLEKLLHELDAIRPSMPVFFLGDLIDRGPDSRAVVDLLITRKCLGVRGNHEDWIRRWSHSRRLDSVAMYPGFGARETLRSYGIECDTHEQTEGRLCEIPAEHRSFFEGLPVALRLEVDAVPYWVVHAGIRARERPVGIVKEQVIPWMAEHRTNELLWKATDPTEMLALDATVISGHLPRLDPIDLGHAIAIDTGSGTLPVARLTAVMLPSRRFLTVR